MGRIISFQGKTPKIHSTAFIAANAIIIGDVEIGADSSIWFGAVLRGDLNQIRIGKETNVQDNVVIHTDPSFPVTIEDSVTIGHGAVIHGCIIRSYVLFGIKATALNGAEIRRYSIIGANSLILERTKIPFRALVLGIPGKVKKELTLEQISQITKSAQEYKKLAKIYLQMQKKN